MDNSQIFDRLKRHFIFWFFSSGDRDWTISLFNAPKQWTTYSIFPIRNDVNAFELLRDRNEPFKVEVRNPNPLVFILRTPELLYLGETCDVRVDVYNRGDRDLETIIELGNS